MTYKKTLLLARSSGVHLGYNDEYAAGALDFAAAIRNAALDEAARICSGIAYSDLLKSEVGECAVAAMRIRALKGK